jgi:hypothetical protein
MFVKNNLNLNSNEQKIEKRTYQTIYTDPTKGKGGNIQKIPIRLCLYWRRGA